LLDRHNGALKTADSAELAAKIDLLLTSEKKVALLNINAKIQAATLKGASQKTSKALLDLLDRPSNGGS
jgi:hypothetical protein